jgi:hypothetical protein
MPILSELCFVGSLMHGIKNIDDVLTAEPGFETTKAEKAARRAAQNAVFSKGARRTVPKIASGYWPVDPSGGGSGGGVGVSFLCAIPNP